MSMNFLKKNNFAIGLVLVSFGCTKNEPSPNPAPALKDGKKLIQIAPQPEITIQPQIPVSASCSDFTAQDLFFLAEDSNIEAINERATCFNQKYFQALETIENAPVYVAHRVSQNLVQWSQFVGANDEVKKAAGIIARVLVQNLVPFCERIEVQTKNQSIEKPGVIAGLESLKRFFIELEAGQAQYYDSVVSDFRRLSSAFASYSAVKNNKTEWDNLNGLLKQFGSFSTNSRPYQRAHGIWETYETNFSKGNDKASFKKIREILQAMNSLQNLIEMQIGNQFYKVSKGLDETIDISELTSLIDAFHLRRETVRTELFMKNRLLTLDSTFDLTKTPSESYQTAFAQILKTQFEIATALTTPFSVSKEDLQNCSTPIF